MKINCIVCEKELDLEDVGHVVGASLGELWCRSCAKEDRETAFNGTVLEGKKRHYTVLNERDLEKYLSEKKLEKLNRVLDLVSLEIADGREGEGKNRYNSYIIINVDEPYIDEIVAVLKKHGHWHDEYRNTSGGK